MKAVAVVKLGNMKEPDISKRGKIQVIDIPEQQMYDEGVKIRIAYCSIYDSDPYLVEGIFGWQPPFGIGHGASGVVIDLGKNATKNGLKVGDRVAGNFLRFCGACYFCRNGKQQFCEHSNGGNVPYPCMSEYVVWHESQVFKLPENVSLEEGCLLELVSIAVGIVDKAEVKIGQKVAICGGEAIGLLGIQLLKMFGIVSLTLIEPMEQRRDMAKKFGADYVIDPVTQNVYNEAMKITDERGFDVVIDVSGAISTVEMLPDITMHGGRVIYGAMYPNNYKMGLNLFKSCYFKELTITGVGFYRSLYCFPRAVQLLPRIDLKDFTNVIYPIDRVEEAFEAHLSGKYPKVLIKCDKF
jgi:threonine dehydrogenase-like Zn-dependent dehydrogenase